MAKTKPMIAALLALSGSVASISGIAAQEAQHPVHEGPSVSIPAGQIAFSPSGVRTDKGELQAGSAYGNLQKGRHGFISPVHTHTEDYFGVVIQGVGANQAPGGKIIPLAAGSYWFQKGEEAHVTQCLSETDCLFFIVQPGKFDYLPGN